MSELHSEDLALKFKSSNGTLRKIPKELDCAEAYIESQLGIKLISQKTRPILLISDSNEEYVASICEDAELTLWNHNTSAILCRIKLNHAKIVSAVFTNDGKKILFASSEGNLEYFEISSQEIVPFFKSLHKIDLVAISFDGFYIWYSTFDSVNVFINSQGSVVHQNCPAAIATCAIFSKCCYTLYIASIFGNLCIYIVENTFAKKTIRASLKLILYLSLTPDEQFICLGHDDNSVVVMELNGYTILSDFSKLYSYPLTSIQENSFLAYFKLISDEYNSNTLLNQKEIAYYKSDINKRVPLVFMNKNKSLLYVNNQNNIKKMCLDQFKTCFFLSSHAQALTCYLIAANDKDLITGGYDGTVRVWDINQKIEKHILFGSIYPVYLLFLTYDKRFLVSVNYESHIVIWNSDTYEMCRVLSEHKNKIISLSCDYSSQYLVIASSDYKIKIWSVWTGLCIKDFKVDCVGICNFSTRNFKYFVDIILLPNSKKFRVWKFFN